MRSIENSAVVKFGTPLVTWWHVKGAVRALRGGGVVAYPTEGVYGLGCDPLDPAAMARLFALKRRAPGAGVILIAAHPDQLRAFVELDARGVLARIASTWPGPTTWLLPSRPLTPVWLTGRNATLAVRVTAHPVAAALCRAFGGPVVSTSANPSGGRPARTALHVRRKLGRYLDFVVPGDIGDAGGPSEIRDALSGRVIRARKAARNVS